MPTDLDQAKYISFTTFRADGSPVPTPVWVVPFDGGYAFTTAADSYKVRRLRADPRVEVCVCDARGSVAPGAPVHKGTANVLDPADSARVGALVKRKYPVAWTLGIAPMNLWRRVRGKATSTTGVRIDLVE